MRLIPILALSFLILGKVNAQLTQQQNQWLNDALHSKINQLRLEKGLKTLEEDNYLSKAAEIHSEYMVAKKKAHTFRGGKNITDTLPQAHVGGGEDVRDCGGECPFCTHALQRC